MTHHLVELRGVSCGYAAAQVVLANVDVAFGEGAFTGIVGPSGAGKTTLLRLLLGSTNPRLGEVRRRPGLRVGYVPQVESVDWNFPVTVGECVLMARTVGRRMPWASRGERARAAATLDRLGIGELTRRHIRELSGGQQQRVFLARALLGEPDLLLLDEPTSGVDARTRHEVLHLLHDLNATGTAIVLTTHDLNGIATHLPDIICLNRSIVAAGRPCDVLTVDALECTFGARMAVLEHAGVPVILDHYDHLGGDEVVRPLRRRAS